MDLNLNANIGSYVYEHEWDECEKNSGVIHQGVGKSGKSNLDHADEDAIPDSPESSDGVGDGLQEVLEDKGDTNQEYEASGMIELFPRSCPGSGYYKSNFHGDNISTSQSFRFGSRVKPADFSPKCAKITGLKRKMEQIPYIETRITERPSTCLAIGESRITERPAIYSSIDEEEIADVSPRKKLKVTCEQIAILEESFELHNIVNSLQKEALAKRLKIQPRQVEVWFQNRRARLKFKKTENECIELKECLEEVSDKYQKLQKEVIELRAMAEDYKSLQKKVIRLKATSPAHGTAAMMCPSCVSKARVINN